MQLLKNKVFIISIILWSFITVVRVLNHVPWFDEAHAWTIAEELNLVEIFKFMKVEGHTFIWYLLLMPFAKLQWGYPYVMQFLNWGFCLIALIIFWAKAPFNNLIKVLITFGFPFLFVYSIYARCYSIGIMLLFILTVCFKDKLNHPIVYSAILVLCANTSAMALFGAFTFGLLFVYEAIKNKIDLKTFIIPIIICLIGAVLVLLQVCGVNDSAMNNFKGINLSNRNFVLFKALIFVSFSVPIFIFLKKTPQILFFLLTTFGILSYVFLFRYYGHIWNHYFYFIYLIIAMWLAISQQNEPSKLKSVSLIILIIFSFINLFAMFFVKEVTLSYVLGTEDSLLLKIFNQDKNLDNKTIIIGNDTFLPYMLLPYHKYKLKNYCEDKTFNYDARNYPAQNQNCGYIKNSNTVYYTNLDIERLSKLIDEEEMYAYLTINQKQVFMNYQGNLYSISRYVCLKNLGEYCLYKITRIK